MYRSTGWSLALFLLIPGLTSCQEPGDIRELNLRDWQPRSMLITRKTEVTRPAFPAIDGMQNGS